MVGKGKLPVEIFCSDRVSSGGECEVAVASMTSIGWVKFGEYQDLLSFEKNSLKINGFVCKSCVRSSMFYGSETWSLDQNEIGIL